MNNCKHNRRCRYTDGFYCEDCNQFFEKESPTYRGGELLNSIYLVLHNINVDSYRAGNGDIKEVVDLSNEIGITGQRDNYEELISRAEVLMNRYGKNSESASITLKDK